MLSYPLIVFKAKIILPPNGKIQTYSPNLNNEWIYVTIRVVRRYNNTVFVNYMQQIMIYSHKCSIRTLSTLIYDDISFKEAEINQFSSSVLAFDVWRNPIMFS